MMQDFVQYKDGNIFPEPISAQEALDILTDFFLGPDFYVAAPLSVGQVNTIVTDMIMSTQPRKYRKYCKKHGWAYKSNIASSKRSKNHPYRLRDMIRRI